MSVNARVFVFESFIYLEASHRLVVREECLVAISKRSAEVLLVLLENAEELVEKEYFFETVWQGAFVEDGNLAVAIAALRKAFRECGIENDLIQTIPKKGYRLQSRVKVLDTPTFEKSYPNLVEDIEKNEALNSTETLAETPTNALSQTNFWNKVYQRKILLFVFCLILLFLDGLGINYGLGGYGFGEQEKPQKQRSLIIPPFTNLHPDENKEDLLGVAVSDRLIAKFEKLKGLKTVPIWNVATLTQLNLDKKSDEVKELADFVLFGNYSVSDEKVTVSTRLIRTADWQILIDKSYQLDADKSLIEMRDLIVAGVTSANGVDEITNGGVLPPIVGEIEQNAYLRYLKGINYLGENKMEESVAEFEAVTGSAPGFGNAWVFLARAHLQIGVRGYGDSSHFEKADDAIQKALALEPYNFNFRVEEADLLLFTGEFAKASSRFEDLLVEDSQNASLLLSQSILYRYIGPIEKSIEWTENFIEQSPSAKVVFPQFIYNEEFDRFEDTMPAPGESDYYNYYLGYLNFYKGNNETAIRHFNKAYQLNSDAFLPQIGKVFASHLEGKSSETKELFESIDKGLAKQVILDGEGLYMVAQAYAVTGDTEKAIQTMERAIDEGFLIYEFFEKDPFMKNIRNNPPFAMNIIKAKNLRTNAVILADTHKFN